MIELKVLKGWENIYLKNLNLGILNFCEVNW